MESVIAIELKLRYQPVATMFTDEKPEGAIQFKEGAQGGCVIAMLTAASKGKTAVFDRNSTGCRGGVSGLCFGSGFSKTPGGFEYFLSTGRGEGYPEGEGYKKSPELVGTFLDALNMTDLPFAYRVFMPLGEVGPESDKPGLVTFYANPDQLSALVVLANYGRAGNDNVIIPFGAGCHSTCLIPYHEAQKELPRAVVGITDISARPRVDADILSFTVPFKMFQEMEHNVRGSFLDRKAWKKVAERIPDPVAPEREG
jgi:hypothetical protein